MFFSKKSDPEGPRSKTQTQALRVLVMNVPSLSDNMPEDLVSNKSEPSLHSCLIQKSFCVGMALGVFAYIQEREQILTVRPTVVLTWTGKF